MRDLEVHAEQKLKNYKVKKCCAVIGWLFINAVDLSKTSCSQTPINGFVRFGDKRSHGFVRM